MRHKGAAAAANRLGEVKSDTPEGQTDVKTIGNNIQRKVKLG